MNTKHDRWLLPVLTFTAVLCGFVCSPAHAADHPLSHSVVTYLPMPAGGEWDHIAISSDGSRLYVGDAYERVVVIDTSTDTVAATITLPNNDFIGGIAVGPNGRVFVTTRTRLMEISPTTNQVVNDIAAPWGWEGPIVVASAGDYAYTHNGIEYFVIDLSGNSVAFVDTIPGGVTNDLIDANPGWSLAWVGWGASQSAPTAIGSTSSAASAATASTSSSPSTASPAATTPRSRSTSTRYQTERTRRPGCG